MQSAGFKLIFWVANDGERAAVVQSLMTTLAARGIQRHGQSTLLAECLHFADELVSRHGDIVGRKSPLCKRVIPKIVVAEHTAVDALPVRQNPAVGAEAAERRQVFAHDGEGREDVNPRQDRRTHPAVPRGGHNPSQLGAAQPAFMLVYLAVSWHHF